MWGSITTKPSTNPYTLSLPISFSNTNYCIFFQTQDNFSARDFGEFTNKTVNSIKFGIKYDASLNASPFVWLAIGY